MKGGRGLWPALLTVAAGAVLTLLAFQQARVLSRQQSESAFRGAARDRVEAVARGLEHGIEAVLSLRDHLAGAERVEPADFHAFAAAVHGRHAYLQALQWLPHVDPAGRAALEADARRRDPGFRFFGRDADGRILELPADATFYGILLVEPLQGNEVTLGYDAEQLPTRQRMLRRALETGAATASGPVRLLQETGTQMGFLVMAPVRGRGGRLLGVVQGVFRAGDLVRKSVAFLGPKGIDLGLRCASSEEPEALLHAEPGGSGRSGPPAQRLEKALDLAGRRWTVTAEADAAAYPAGPGWRAWTVLLLGSACSLLLGGHLRLVRGREAEVRAQVEARTAELQRETEGHQRDAEALRRSESRYRQLVEAMDEGLWILDAEGHTTFANRRLCALLGCAPEAMPGLPLAAFVPEREAGRARRLLEDWRAGAAAPQDFRFQRRDGTDLWAIVSGTSIAAAAGGGEGILVMLTDITARKRTEELQLQAQKLESLGVLAGGIAHDFNNLLTAIQGNLELALLNLPDGQPGRAPLENLGRSVQRAAHLTRQMLAYSGRGRFQVAPLDLNQCVRDISHLLAVSLSKKVQLRFELAADLPALVADAAQIQQVAMNLVTNAAEAIGDREGTVVLRTGHRRWEEAELAERFPGQGLEPGDYLSLHVADTGCGMQPEVQARIFEPFFTTKFTGRGLGLSSMLGIVRGHGGGIRIDSEVGQGTTFHLLFPASPPGAAAPAEAIAGAPWKGSGGLLLVDDEPAVREATAQLVRDLGFDVREAGDGLEAVEAFRAEADRFRLVLMDLTMPRLGGLEACREIRRMAPACPLVLASGFHDQPTVPEPGLVAAFLRKPYTRQDLVQALRQALQA